MFGQYFYHEKIRKCVAVFGRLFNNLYVMRQDANGQVLSQLKVPLSYAPKRKFLDRLAENPDLINDTKVAIKLPRMSFEIVNFAYDASRQLSKVTNFNAIGAGPNRRQKFYSPVPYRISFQLNIYAKTQDDALQVVEQIIPTFNPQYTLTILPFPDSYPTLKEDLPITITGLSFQDDYEGSMESRRTIIYTLDFDMNVMFYGPIVSGEVIRKSVADIYDIQAGLQDSDLLLSKITSLPDPLTTFGTVDSDFGFNTIITDLYDSAP